MNKYRRFKYPFGGETPQEFADARRAYYENVGNSALQAINAVAPQNANTAVQTIDASNPREYLRQYTERVRPEVERRVNEMNRKPSGNGKIIRNHDKLYDYYKDGDRLYYRKKGGKNWIDISDNDVAQKRINATIAKNKKSYGIKKVASQTVEDTKTYDAGTLNEVVVTGSRSKIPTSVPKRVQGSTTYKSLPKSQSNPNRNNNMGIIFPNNIRETGIAQLPANYNKPRVNKMIKTAVANRDASRKKGGFVGWFMNGIR